MLPTMLQSKSEVSCEALGLMATPRLSLTQSLIGMSDEFNLRYTVILLCFQTLCIFLHGRVTQMCKFFKLKQLN